MTPASIEDWFGINSLFARYATALDDGDVAGVVGCFTEDASVESPVVGAYVGHAQIRRFAERLARVRQAGAQLRHVISNLTAEVEGDRASARCYLLTAITRDGKSALLGPGTYDCELVRTPQGWLFTRRVVAMDHPIVLPGA